MSIHENLERVRALPRTTDAVRHSEPECDETVLAVSDNGRITIIFQRRGAHHRRGMRYVTLEKQPWLDHDMYDFAGESFVSMKEPAQTRNGSHEWFTVPTKPDDFHHGDHIPFCEVPALGSFPLPTARRIIANILPVWIAR